MNIPLKLLGLGSKPDAAQPAPSAAVPPRAAAAGLMTHLHTFYLKLEEPVSDASRLGLIALILVLALSYMAPLWRISMLAPQYPQGLYVDIYSYKVEGGNQGHDIQEINELNHYIGMDKIEKVNLADLDWMPFALGLLILLTLRVAAIGNGRSLVDLAVLTSYLMAFALGRYVYRLYIFGHNLDPRAAIHVEPFMPVVVGTKQVANFTVSSYPQLGGVLMLIFTAGVAAITLWHVWKAVPSLPEGCPKRFLS